MQRVWQWLSLGLLLVLAWSGSPGAAWGAPQTLPVLTLDTLQQRLASPVLREGRPTIDLRRLVIDLRPENGDFRDRFYGQLRNTLQDSDPPPALDLSDAVIKGEFNLQRLSVREPLYGDNLSPLLTEKEQAQLRRDRRRLSQLSQLSRSLLLQPQPTALRVFLFQGPLILSQTRFEGMVTAADVFFLGSINGQGAQFIQEVNFSESRFSEPADFIAAQFQQGARFRNALFFSRARFSQSYFGGAATFQGSEFEQTARFSQVTFAQNANFSRIQFRDDADFAQTTWQDTVAFTKSVFSENLFLTNARLEALVSLRQTRFNQPVNLRGASVLRQLDLGDAVFVGDAYVNVAAMDFNADQAEILGSPGQIGRVLSVPALAGNETLLRNLVRNFRKLEQIPDANYLEYRTERLRLQDLQKRLVAVNLNTASVERLQAVGFSETQAQAIVARRQEQPFVRAADVLNLDGIDLAAYVKVRDRIVAQPSLQWPNRLALALVWLGLAALLLMSHYGTSVGLAFGVGMVAVALSSLLFWWVDRYRRRWPLPVVPPWSEVAWMVGSFGVLMGLGSLTIMRLGDWPGLTLLAIAVAALPIPLALMVTLYRRGRYHDLMHSSYLVEDGSARQLRLLIARLPVIPKFPFYRDRYTPILWDRRRNWLNYYDFSFNNWFKFGFNEIRLRDEAVPGLVTALVWYQWAVGLAYVALLLWTLSRTIPGLNLLLYF